MLVHLDHSVLVDAFTKPHRSMPALRATVSSGEVVAFSTLALYEWLRGPRTETEREDATAFFAASAIVVFGPAEATRAAALYQQLPRARSRQGDIAIAACAIEHDAALWTLNPQDFADVPGLKLYRP